MRIPVRVFIRYFLHLEITGQENIKELQGPLIIASNHFHTIDVFVIATSLPKNSKLIPIRYGVSHKHYWHFINFPIIWLMGSFELPRGKGLDYALRTPTKLLQEGRVVGIFPEGTRQKSGLLNPGRKGTAYLAMKTNTAILPMYIDGNYQMNTMELLLRRRTIRVTIGKPFFVTNRGTDEKTLNRNASVVMERIRELNPTT